MSTTAEQLRAKGFVEQADGSFAKVQTVGKLHVGIITRSSAGGVGESHSSNPRTPRQPVANTEDRLNKTEKRFLAVLRARTSPTYETIGIQEITLRLGFDLRYSPDFHTVSPSGMITFYEVKGGFEREDAIVKLKAAAAKFPYFRFIKAVWKDGQWAETTIRT